MVIVLVIAVVDLNSVHLVEDILQLTLHNDTDIFAYLCEFCGDICKLAFACCKVNNHHHIEEILDDGLRDVENIYLVICKIVAHFSNNANGVFSHYGDNGSCHIVYPIVLSALCVTSGSC